MITCLLVISAACFAIPVVTLLIQAAAASPRIPALDLAGPRPKVAVLIPAHNEQFVIRDTLASIKPQLTAGDRVIVIADNCSDHTAEAARQEGAEVTVRNDPGLRGKGYALDQGIRFVEGTEIPDVVIFVDADCTVKPDCIDRLARMSAQTGQPVQAAYLMNLPQPPRRMGAIVTFAWKVRDYVRPLGWMHLSLPCQLSGSGMAFPWRLVRAVDIASSNLTEDLKQGLDLALIGYYVRFCPQAVVTSNVGQGGEPSRAQRARWEHGTLALIGQYTPKLLIRFLASGSMSLFAVMLDLCVPPLALLALVVVGDLAVTSLFATASSRMMPLVLASANCMLLAIAVLLAWWRHGRDILPLRWLAFAPVYALRKIPLYVGFFFDRQHDWVRGERDVGG